MCAIDITAEQRKTVLALLARHLPNTTAWVYGSRVKWTSRPESDLDLVVFAKPEQERRVSDLREAFEESNLPFRVDLFVWDEVPEQFRKTIEAEHVVLVERRELGKGGGWRVDSVGDFFDLVTGYAFKSSDFSDDGIPVVKIKNVKAGHFSKHQFSYVSPDFLDTRSEKIALVDDLLISMSGNRHDGSPETWVGKVALFREEDAYLINQRVGALRLKRNAGLDARFASFLLSSYQYEELFISIATSSGGQANLSPEQILGAPVRYPEIGEQRAIAHILGTLDDKIELNRRMNQTLEAMARALFKSWFVDFDPVRAKATLKHHAANHSPLAQARGRSPQSSRWGEIKRSYTQQILEKAKPLRQSQTDAEGLLWHYLRNKQLDGHKFRRQQPIGPYIVDFVCVSRKLVIELDGGQHAEQHTYDKKRDDYFRGKGYRILRFWNNEVFQNCMDVLEAVYQALVGPPPHQPSFEGSATGPPPHQPSPDGSASATPPQGGSDWSVERARAYLNRMDPNIAALFPDSFVDSELGPIPRGWEVKALGDVVVNSDSKRIPVSKARRVNRPGIFPYYGAAGLMDYIDDYIFDGIYLLIGEDGSVVKSNDLAVTQYVWGRLWVNNHAHVLQGRGSVSTEQLYLNFNFEPVGPYVTGAVQPKLSQGRMNTMPFVFAGDDVCRAFATAVDPWFAKLRSVTDANKILGALRDTLLPKLMSGEVRMKDITPLGAVPQLASSE